MLQALAQRAEAIGADVVNAGLLGIEREHIAIHQVVCVDELEADVAAADDIHVAAFLDPLEEDLKNPKPSLAENRARADDDERQVRLAQNFAHRQLAGELAAAVNLNGPWRCVVRDRAFVGRAEERARTHVDEALHAGLHRFLGGDARAVDVDFPELVAGLRERHERDVVVDNVHALHGAADAVAVADVALHILDVLRPRGVRPDVEDANLLAACEQAAGDEVAEKAGAASDEVLHVVFYLLPRW